MRKIKFRIWDNDYKIMRPVILIDFKDGQIVEIEAEPDKTGAHIFRPEDNTEQYKCYQLLKFTGFYDKNEAEIFEGDIVKIRVYNFVYENKLVVLPDFFESKGYCEKELGENWDAENLEIIGNVYENPELLEGI